jgi:hypothetical protein
MNNKIHPCHITDAERPLMLTDQPLRRGCGDNDIGLSQLCCGTMSLAVLRPLLGVWGKPPGLLAQRKKDRGKKCQAALHLERRLIDRLMGDSTRDVMMGSTQARTDRKPPI